MYEPRFSSFRFGKSFGVLAISKYKKYTDKKDKSVITFIVQAKNDNDNILQAHSAAIKKLTDSQGTHTICLRIFSL